MRNETNFVHHGVPASSRDLMFGPLDGEDGPFLTFGDMEKLCHLMFRAGLFPSISEARRNGWDKPVPRGWSEFVVGAKRHHVWILNRTNPVQEYIDVEVLAKQDDDEVTEILANLSGY